MISNEEYDALVAIRDRKIFVPHELLGISEQFEKELIRKGYIHYGAKGNPCYLLTEGKRAVEEYERFIATEQRAERAEQLAIKADKRGDKHLRLDYWAIIIAGISLVISIASIILSICK